MADGVPPLLHLLEHSQGFESFTKERQHARSAYLFYNACNTLRASVDRDAEFRYLYDVFIRSGAQHPLELGAHIRAQIEQHAQPTASTSPTGRIIEIPYTQPHAATATRHRPKSPFRRRSVALSPRRFSSTSEHYCKLGSRGTTNLHEQQRARSQSMSCDPSILLSLSGTTPVKIVGGGQGCTVPVDVFDEAQRACYKFLERNVYPAYLQAVQDDPSLARNNRAQSAKAISSVSGKESSPRRERRRGSLLGGRPLTRQRSRSAGMQTRGQRSRSRSRSPRSFSPGRGNISPSSADSRSPRSPRVVSVSPRDRRDFAKIDVGNPPTLPQILEGHLELLLRFAGSIFAQETVEAYLAIKEYLGNKQPEALQTLIVTYLLAEGEKAANIPGSVSRQISALYEDRLSVSMLCQDEELDALLISASRELFSLMHFDIYPKLMAKAKRIAKMRQ